MLKFTGNGSKDSSKKPVNKKETPNVIESGLAMVIKPKEQI
jgi:hypothetical protein